MATDPSALRTLILALPAEHPARVAFDPPPGTPNDDAACAAALNVRDQPGYVPRRDVVVALTNFPVVDGVIKYVLQFGTLPEFLGQPGRLAATPEGFQLYCLFQALSRVAANDVGVLPMLADLAAGCAAAQGALTAALIPDGFLAYLTAREVELSRPEAAGLVRYGADVTAADVGAAR